jgi:hypothetical protein
LKDHGRLGCASARSPVRTISEHARQAPDVKQKLNAIGQAVSTDSVDKAGAALRNEAQQGTSRSRAQHRVRPNKS